MLTTVIFFDTPRPLYLSKGSGSNWKALTLSSSFGCLFRNVHARSPRRSFLGYADVTPGGSNCSYEVMTVSEPSCPHLPLVGLRLPSWPVFLMPRTVGAKSMGSTLCALFTDVHSWSSPLEAASECRLFFFLLGGISLIWSLQGLMTTLKQLPLFWEAWGVPAPGLFPSRGVEVSGLEPGLAWG